MNRLLAAVALAGTFASPFVAAQDAMSDPSCGDYMAMSESERLEAVQKMDGSMADGAVTEESATDGNVSMTEMGSGSDASGAMGTDTLAMNAEEACSAHPDGSVGEALEMMAGG